MKKLGFLFSCVAVLALSSCSKNCKECSDCPVTVTLPAAEICEADYESEEAFDIVINSLTNAGCNCK